MRRGLASTVRSWCRLDGAGGRGLAIALSACLLLVVGLRWPSEIWRLVGSHAPHHAPDLRQRWSDVHACFGGGAIYISVDHTGYPWATFTLLWPWLGWLPVSAARILWAALHAPLIFGSLCYLARALPHRNRWQQAGWMLLLFSGYPLAVTVGNGQLGVVSASACVAALLLLELQRPVRLRTDLLAALLFCVGLCKPSSSAPFFWILLLRPRRLRPAALAAGMYALAMVIPMILRWGRLAQDLVALRDTTSSTVGLFGRVHVHEVLQLLGLGRLAMLMSLLILIALGFWVHRHRAADLWLLLGVSAVVTRLWTYHNLYDDLLLFLACVPLARLPGRLAPWGWASLIAILGLFVLPGTWGNADARWHVPYRLFQGATWLCALGLLLASARRGRTESVPSSAPMAVPIG